MFTTNGDIRVRAADENLLGAGHDPLAEVGDCSVLAGRAIGREPHNLLCMRNEFKHLPEWPAGGVSIQAADDNMEGKSIDPLADKTKEITEELPLVNDYYIVVCERDIGIFLPELIKMLQADSRKCVLVMTGNTACSVAGVTTVINDEDTITDRLVPANTT